MLTSQPYCRRAALIRGRLLCTTMLTSVALLASTPAWANPQGGTVVGGTATITQAPSLTTIDQASDKAIIDWRSFSIGHGETTRFNQPSSNAIALNRVTGNDASAILGRLQANGNVWLVNPNGILFGPGAQVDVNGILATTADIVDHDFLAGRFDFSIPSPESGASVINQGGISIGETGLAGLVAPHVRNDGIIVGRLGKVILAGAETFTLDFYGDGMIQFATTSRVVGGVDPERALVENDGTISVDGGTVLITAAAAAGVVENVLNMDGVIEARSFALHDGAIVLNGGGEGIVRVAGALDASGLGAGDRGGTVKVLGDRVGLFAGAAIDVSGDAGGGDVLVGGNFQGNGPEANAARTFVAAEATIAADAGTDGDGGRVIAWSDEGTRFYGTVTARGGAQGGDGGFVEISGRDGLEYAGSLDLGAPAGDNGSVLFDPDSIVIGELPQVPDPTEGDGSFAAPFTSTENGGILPASTIEAALATADVFVQTSGDADVGDGNITIEFGITAPDGAIGDLTLTAHGDIALNAPIDMSAAGDLALLADGVAPGDGAGAIEGAGAITMGDGALLLLSAGSGIGNLSPIVVDNIGNVAAATTNGGISLDVSGSAFITTVTNPVAGTVVGFSAPNGGISVELVGTEGSGDLTIGDPVTASDDISLTADGIFSIPDNNGATGSVTSSGGNILIAAADFVIEGSIEATADQGEITLRTDQTLSFVPDFDSPAGADLEQSEVALLSADVLSFDGQGSSVDFNAPINFANDTTDTVNVTSAGLVTVNDRIATFGADLNMTAGSSFDSSTGTLDTSSADVGGSVAITATGDIATADIFTSQATSTAGGITLTSADGLIDSSAGDLNAVAGVGDAGVIRLEASGDITTGLLATSSTEGAGGDITVISSAGAINATGDLNSISVPSDAGAILLDAAGDITTGDIFASAIFLDDSGTDGTGSSGGITITSAGGDISTGGLLSPSEGTFGSAGSSGAITVTANGGSIFVDGNAWAFSNAAIGGGAGDAGDGGAVTFIALTDIDITGSIFVQSRSDNGTAGDGGAVTMTSTEGSISMTGAIGAGSTGTVGSGAAGPLNLTAANAFSGISLSNVPDDLIEAGNITVTGGAVSLASEISGEDVSITSAGNLFIGDPITATGTIHIIANDFFDGDAVVAGNIFVGNSVSADVGVTMDADGDVSIFDGGLVSADQDISIVAGDDFLVDGEGGVSADRNIDIFAAGFFIGAPITAENGEIALRTDQSLAFTVFVDDVPIGGAELFQAEVDFLTASMAVFEGQGIEFRTSIDFRPSIDFPRFGTTILRSVRSDVGAEIDISQLGGTVIGANSLGIEVDTGGDPVNGGSIALFGANLVSVLAVGPADETSVIASLGFANQQSLTIGDVNPTGIAVGNDQVAGDVSIDVMGTLTVDESIDATEDVILTAANLPGENGDAVPGDIIVNAPISAISVVDLSAGRNVVFSNAEADVTAGDFVEIFAGTDDAGIDGSISNPGAAQIQIIDLNGFADSGLDMFAETGIGAAGAPIITSGGVNVSAVNTGAGVIFIENRDSGDLEIVSFDFDDGGDDVGSVTTNFGDVQVVNTAGSVIVNSGVEVGGIGEIVLRAEGVDSDLEINDLVAADAVFLFADDDVRLLDGADVAGFVDGVEVRADVDGSGEGAIENPGNASIRTPNLLLTAGSGIGSFTDPILFDGLFGEGASDFSLAEATTTNGSVVIRVQGIQGGTATPTDLMVDGPVAADEDVSLTGGDGNDIINLQVNAPITAVDRVELDFTGGIFDPVGEPIKTDVLTMIADGSIGNADAPIIVSGGVDVGATNSGDGGVFIKNIDSGDLTVFSDIQFSVTSDGGDIHLVNPVGDIAVDSLVQTRGGGVFLNAFGQVTIGDQVNATSGLTTVPNSDEDTSILIVTGESFQNNAGAAALNPDAEGEAGTRFLVYSIDPAEDERGGLPGEELFDRSFPDDFPPPESGDLFLYQFAPPPDDGDLGNGNELPGPVVDGSTIDPDEVEPEALPIVLAEPPGAVFETAPVPPAKAEDDALFSSGGKSERW